jgi:hypothetical protein
LNFFLLFHLFARFRGVRAEKTDQELFFINKTKSELNDNKEKPKAKKPKLSLQEKLSNLRCYNNLKPDPYSAPVHLLRHRPKAQEGSKRQASMRKNSALKNQSSRNALTSKTDSENENNKNSQDESTSDDQQKDKENLLKRKQDVLIETNFQNDLWASNSIY